MKSEKTELGGMAVSVERIGIQGIGFIGTILFFLSYQCRSNKTLFRIQFVSYLCYTVHLLLLGAVTGGISYILNTIRSFCLGSKNSFLRSWLMCAVLCALQVAALVFTWGGGCSSPSRRFQVVVRLRFPPLKIFSEKVLTSLS